MVRSLHSGRVAVAADIHDTVAAVLVPGPGFGFVAGRLVAEAFDLEPVAVEPAVAVMRPEAAAVETAVDALVAMLVALVSAVHSLAAAVAVVVVVEPAVDAWDVVLVAIVAELAPVAVAAAVAVRTGSFAAAPAACREIDLAVEIVAVDRSDSADASAVALVVDDDCSCRLAAVDCVDYAVPELKKSNEN